MPLFSEHISNMYYSGAPSYSTPYTGYSSVLPLGSSYSASYLNPGATYSKHSSLGGYSRPPPLASRWVTSSGRNYASMLSPISERGTSSPVRINSPRRIPFTGKRSYTAPSYTPRPININTADIDVSKDKYRHKHENHTPPPEPAPEIDNGPFMPRVDGKPETGIDSSPGLQRSTIRRGRTVVRLHTIKRKDRDSPRKPQSELEQQTQTITGESTLTNQSDDPTESNDNDHLPWREKLSEDLTYKDKREKKTLGAKLVEKFIVKDKDSDSEGSFKEKKQSQETAQTLPVAPVPSSSSAYSRSPDRRCSMELLAEQANVLDSLIKGENLSLATLDLSKVGLQEKPENNNQRQPSIKRRKSSDPNNPLQTTKSDHSLNESLKLNKNFSKKRSLKKSSSGGSIYRLDSIKEFVKEPISSELPVIIENSAPVKRESVKVKPKPKLKAVITSSVEITEQISPIKFKIDVTVEETPSPPKTPKTPKKEIIYSTIVEDTPCQPDDYLTPEKVPKKYNKRKTKPLALDDVSPEPEEGNFWDKIGKRETIYLMKRKQIIDENKEKNRRALFWFPEEDETNEETENDNNNNVLDKNSSLDGDTFFSDACDTLQSNDVEKIEQNVFSSPKREYDTLSLNKEEKKETVHMSEVINKRKPEHMIVDKNTEKIVEKKMENKVKSLREQTETVSKSNAAKKVIDPRTFDKKIQPVAEIIKEEEKIDVPNEKNLSFESKMDKLIESEVNAQSKIDKTLQTADKEIKTIEEKLISSAVSNIEDKNTEAEKVGSADTCPSCGGIKDSYENPKDKIIPNSDPAKSKVVVENVQKTMESNIPCKVPENCIPEVKKTNSFTKISESKADKETSSNKATSKSSPGKQLKKENETANKSAALVQPDNKINTNITGAIPKVPQVKAKTNEKLIIAKKVSPMEKDPQNKADEKLITVEDVGSKLKEPQNKVDEKTIIAEVDAALTKTTQIRTKVDKEINKTTKVSTPNNDSESKLSQKNITNSESNSETSSKQVEVAKIPDVPVIIKSENIPNNEKEKPSQIESTHKDLKTEVNNAELERHPVTVEKLQLQPPTPVEILKPPSPRRPVKEEPALKPLIATPRPLQKRVPQVIHSSSSSASSSSEESSDEDEDADESDTSEESAEFYECENNPDGRTSTGSNDSGFDSSAPTSPAGFMHIKKGGECAGTSTAPAQADAADLVEQELEQSTAYGLFRKTGRFTPPARSIPRFRKYNIEDFHFIKVLGKGSFGKVLLAELRDTEYYYAVKCLKKDVVLEDDDVECTLIERKVLALGTNHPYLCHLFATFQTDSHLFFVMEYLNGGDLMFHIQQSGRFPEARARFYAAEIVSGLKFLHKRGIVYRDLKLDNILLDFDGHVRIADFGMCKLQIYLEKTADTFCGTPDYMAPEIIKGLKYNQTVDWWSFGVLLYEMLIGQSPFSGCDEDELFWSICNEMPSYPRFLSTEALTILTRLLDKDARTRLGGTECMHGDVREQEFFHQIHWDKLERRELEAPFRPRVRHPLDTQYFDRAFTGERPRLTAVEPHVLRTMDQEAFRGFSYTNPNATDR